MMPKRKENDSYVIIVDGETEKWYIDLLKSSEKNNLPRISIKPEIPTKKKLESLYNQVKEYAGIYDLVIWIIDLDTVIKENKCSDLRNYYNNLKQIDNVKIIINTPCIEFWYLLHFQNTGRFYLSCDPVEKELKKHHPLNDYKKTQKYYKAGIGIYKKLLPFINDALTHSKTLGNFNPSNMRCAKSEMFELYSILNLHQ